MSIVTFTALSSFSPDAESLCDDVPELHLSQGNPTQLSLPGENSAE